MTLSSVLVTAACLIGLSFENGLFAAAYSPSFVVTGNIHSKTSHGSYHQQRHGHSVLPFLSSSVADDVEESDNESPSQQRQQPRTTSLPDAYPLLSAALDRSGFRTPTPIQRASMTRVDDNLLLIAPTGSGKTLAYVLPALTAALERDGTVLIVAPTRELAVQLLRDTCALLGDDDDSTDVLLAVKGVALPGASELNGATVLVGTPPEVLETLTTTNKGGLDFCAGDVLQCVVLDEVDVLLPNLPKQLRTSLDKGGKKQKKVDNYSGEHNAKERRQREQKRKLQSMKRRGTDVSSDQKHVVSPTDKILKLVASRRFVVSSRNGNNNNKSSEETTTPYRVLAGSATASRRTLDRLNRSLRDASIGEALSTVDVVWDGDVKMCRPISSIEEDDVDSSGDNNTVNTDTQHTIRSVVVPEQVEHKYISVDSNSAASVLSAVATATKALRPETALLFLCGEFGKKADAVAKQTTLVKKGATSQARRNSKRKHDRTAERKAKQDKTTTTSTTTTLSARRACSTLQDHGVDARPLHVALGLEGKAGESFDDQEEDGTSPRVLVTFEGSARGLHFDAVDVVFVVGRPSSAASYLHLAGRVGRTTATMTTEGVDDRVVPAVRPGTVVSLCTSKGGVTELQKWTRQVTGGNGEELLEELCF